MVLIGEDCVCPRCKEDAVLSYHYNSRKLNKFPHNLNCESCGLDMYSEQEDYY